MTLVLLGVLALVILGAIVSAFFGKIHSPINPLPADLPQFSETEVKIVDLYMTEWKVIIETQMHFNDLIIRFRTLTLTTFAALVGAAITIGKAAALSQLELGILLWLPCMFWISAWVIDFFYYHRLLVGAVAEAAKFDEAPWFAQRGLFGMTACIRTHAPPARSRVLLLVYYVLPLLVLVGLLWWFTIHAPAATTTPTTWTPKH